MSRNRSGYLRRFYGGLAPQFDTLMELLYGGRDRAWRSAALDVLPDGSELLEVGAGTGRTAAMAGCPDDMISLDISRGMLTVSNAIETPVQGDVHRLPFETDTFDGVLGVLLLSTQIDQARALEEVARVCKPSGKIVFVDTFSRPGRAGRLLDRTLNVVTSPLAFDFDVDIERIAASRGLTVARREPTPENMRLVELVVLEP